MSGTTINDWPLPYVERLDPRDPASVVLAVIHCTELPDLATAREYGERVVHDSDTGNSGHYYIDRDGAIHRFVRETRIAHHARDHNAHSVGIELVNRGRYPDWFDSRRQEMDEPYPAVQIDALQALIEYLKAELPNLERIAGHEDLDRTRVPASDDPALEVARKRDPGPMFPWDEVLRRSGLAREP
ncbi:MAG TPA: N-acetylmuramoyl-L-alanine amidase [Candidatus Saccharimonadia bacterium]|nr:N-acetylmuramoyl-L-alanine amidase [Candidatus Saccharimonadia bacterium]